MNSIDEIKIWNPVCLQLLWCRDTAEASECCDFFQFLIQSFPYLKKYSLSTFQVTGDILFSGSKILFGAVFYMKYFT